MKNSSKKPRLVFDFIRPPTNRLAEVNKGVAPKESLLGYVQLKERGWPVSTSDDRWHGLLGDIRIKLIRFIEIPSFRMIKQWLNGDVIIIVTRISLSLTLTAKLLNKKVIFLDAMCEEVPSRTWRRLATKKALNLADACICFSSTQATHWAEELGLPVAKFTPLNYFVDDKFYTHPSDFLPGINQNPYILAVGRDPKRDFETLVAAADELKWDLKLVTLPYLVPEGIRDNSRVQILANLSYNELFSLYGNAAVVVVPVKPETTYMSGIRAIMEAMLLGAPIAASRTPGLMEYFTDDKDLVFFEPGNPKSLVKAILKIVNNDEFRQKLTFQAKQNVVKSYSLSKYAESLENILYSL